MKKITLLFLVLFALSCDDGNIDVPEFVFDGELQVCSISKSDSQSTFVFYKTSENEALSIEVATLDTDYLTLIEDKNPILLTTSGANTIRYRTFSDNINGTNYFCKSVPPSEPTLITEWIGEAILNVVTEETLDDKDGVPTEEEDNLENDDIDGDSIPNYLDTDDDGDGILTKDEISKDSNGNYLDTDGDGTPNYLDKDDDGDGIATINENANGDDKLNSLDDDNGNGIPNYLDPEDNQDYTNNAIEQVKEAYFFIYTNTFTVTGLNLTNTDERSIRFDVYELGAISTELPYPGNNTTEPK